MNSFQTIGLIKKIEKCREFETIPGYQTAYPNESGWSVVDEDGSVSMTDAQLKSHLEMIAEGHRQDERWRAKYCS